MLKTRIIPIVLLNDYNVVKSIQFSTFRNLGNPITVCEVYESRGVDELVLLDIKATVRGRPPVTDIISDISSECFMPLTIGGGIRTIEHARALLKAGADKVAINSFGVENPAFISKLANEFGSQCVVVSVDYRVDATGSRRVYTRAGTQATDLDPVDWAKQAEALGAGEILFNSIERDGMMNGFDLEALKAVTRAVRVPVIACGGAGSSAHMHEGLSIGGASAVAAASMFQFTEQTPDVVREYLREKGVPVRWA